MPVSPWDLRLGLRTLSLSLVTVGLATVVDVVTRERGVPGTTATIGVLPVVPLAVAVAAVIAIAPARSGGELTGLVALGVSPLRARAAAFFVAAAISAGAGTLLAARGEVDALFPAPAHASDYRPEGDGFVSPRKSVRVDAGDHLVRLPSAPAPSVPGEPAHRRIGAGLAVALAGLALALFAVAPVKRSAVRAASTLVGYGAAQVLAFQLSGAGQLPALLSGVPGALLFGLVLVELSRATELRKPARWI
ncbi:MAG: hypothetical protein JNL79_29605 [Myxococcales bacterium]|nr:hypothetical protein [Myxococcales bacterium]